MKLTRQFLAAAFTAIWALPTFAVPNADEIKQLGNTLTAFGAEKAGNKDGTIPAYSGGLCEPVAGYKPLDANGGFPYVDPFAAEKPLFSIIEGARGQIPFPIPKTGYEAMWNFLLHYRQPYERGDYENYFVGDVRPLQQLQAPPHPCREGVH